MSPYFNLHQVETKRNVRKMDTVDWTQRFPSILLLPLIFRVIFQFFQNYVFWMNFLAVLIFKDVPSQHYYKTVIILYKYEVFYCFKSLEEFQNVLILS